MKTVQLVAALLLFLIVAIMAVVLLCSLPAPVSVGAPAPLPRSMPSVVGTWQVDWNGVRGTCQLTYEGKTSFDVGVQVYGSWWCAWGSSVYEGQWNLIKQSSGVYRLQIEERVLYPDGSKGSNASYDAVLEPGKRKGKFLGGAGTFALTPLPRKR